jgi:peptidyl-prolyl cis-trans isomerase B (cyclophilin B)
LTSNRDRQRATARARLEQQMSDRAEQLRRRRRTQLVTAVGVGAIVVIVGAAFLVYSLTDDNGTPAAAPSADPSASTSAAPAPTKCEWLPAQPTTPPVDPSAPPVSPAPSPTLRPELKEVGTPPANEPRSGTQVMTMNTTQGTVKVTIDTANAPCAAASMTFLAGKNFFDGSKCHRMVTSGIFVLQCGDPSATGLGGPTYTFAEENLPTGSRPAYPEGTVAMAKAQAPASTASQFFIVYKDTELPADYTVLGRITEGLDVIKKVAEGGVTPDPQSQSPNDGAPKLEIKINTLTVAAPSA